MRYPAAPPASAPAVPRAKEGRWAGPCSARGSAARSMGASCPRPRCSSKLDFGRLGAVSACGGRAKFEEVLHNQPAAFGQDALGMELHAPNWVLLVADSHDFAFLGFRGDLEKIRDGVALDHEGMVAGGGERVGHAGEQILA